MGGLATCMLIVDDHLSFRRLATRMLVECAFVVIGEGVRRGVGACGDGDRAAVTLPQSGALSRSVAKWCFSCPEGR
jgi:hypothetical protein